MRLSVIQIIGDVFSQRMNLPTLMVYQPSLEHANLPPALQAVTMLSLHWNGWAWHSMTLAKTMPEAQSHRLLPGHGSSTLADMGMFEGNCSPPVKRIAPTSN